MLLEDIFENDIEDFLQEKTPTRKKVVRKGKVQKKKTCPDGFKLVDGKCVRQKADEKRKRSRAAKKSNKTGKAQRKRSAERSRRVRDRKNL